MGCYRIRHKDLEIVECEGRSCRKSKAKFPEAVRAVELFRNHDNLDLIRDGDFLFGGIKDERVIGKRIGVLPDGVKLNKAFPLFAKDLAIHDEKSHGHWDVIFRNPSGKFCYLYSLDKIKNSKKKKFSLVDDFERRLPRLKKNLMAALGESELVLAMLVLLKTKMRVGGEIYYKRSHHKGLTTLKKKNLKISGDKIIFDFVGKDGVPQIIEESFERKVLDELKRILKKRKKDDFVFLKEDGKIFRDSDFEVGFERFCGERFYPHIVRSHFATREVERFLRNRQSAIGNRRGEDVKEFCLDLAGKLGHKKFSKKSGAWENSYEVTLHHYVRPDLVEKIKSIV
jgi:hypothetical protein